MILRGLVIMNDSSRAGSSFKEIGRFRERISIRAIFLLIGVFVFDLTWRIVPAISTPVGPTLVISGVDHTRFLVGDESEVAYLLSKLDDFTAPGSEEAGREDLGVEKSASESQIQVSQGPELKLIGIFKSSDVFAVIEQVSEGRDDQMPLKARVGDEIFGLRVDEITQSSVTLIGPRGLVEVIEIFGRNLSEANITGDGVSP